METELIDKLFLELSQFTNAVTKKELILAQALLDTRIVCGDESGECFVCEELQGKHKEDCPILLAEILTK